MCVYDEHPLAGRDIQYWAAKSWSKYTTDDKVGKVNYVKVILNQNDSCNCVTCKIDFDIFILTAVLDVYPKTSVTHSFIALHNKS